MTKSYNPALVVGATLSILAALLHVGVIVGGESWYRFFGAGEQFAQAAAQGAWWPAVVTAGITLILLIWAAYALSAAGAIRALPWLKAGILLITAIYLLRGLALFPAWLFSPAEVTPFVIWSSVICLAYGGVHLLGVVQVWSRL